MKKAFNKAVNIVALMAVVIAPAGCSKSSKSTPHGKVVKQKEDSLSRRRPKDNIFIQEGGYSKKSKVHPFAKDVADNVPPSSEVQANNVKEEHVVYEKQEKKIEKVAALTSPSTQSMHPLKANGFKRFFAKIASVFLPKKQEAIQVASRDATYRPILNEMAISGKYVYDHDNLIEQGSSSFGYEEGDERIEVLSPEPAAYIDSKPMLTPLLNKVGPKRSANKPQLVKAVVKTPVAKIESIVLPAVIKESSMMESEVSLENKLTTTITGLMDVSKALYGINVSEKESVESSNMEFPEITDYELRKGSNKTLPNLAEVPPVPAEFSSRQS